mgnify:CR=1 FL=1
MDFVLAYRLDLIAELGMKTTKFWLLMMLIGNLLTSCSSKKFVLDPDLYNLGPRIDIGDRIMIDSAMKSAILEINETELAKSRVRMNEIVKIKKINRDMANNGYLKDSIVFYNALVFSKKDKFREEREENKGKSYIDIMENEKPKKERKFWDVLGAVASYLIIAALLAGFIIHIGSWASGTWALVTFIAYLGVMAILGIVLVFILLALILLLIWPKDLSFS